jgi:sec-independent protein translocase protein TatA
MLIDYSLNIGGSEAMIILFIILFLILGTNKLPEAARKLGRASYEFNKAKKQVENQMNGVSSSTVEISGPVQNEREKIETIAKSLGIKTDGVQTKQLQKQITEMIGEKTESNDKPK